MSNSGYRGALILPRHVQAGYIPPLLRMKEDCAAGGPNMKLGRGRKLAVRVLAGVAISTGLAGTWAAYHWTDLQIRYFSYRMESAENEADRARWAERLVGRGDAGIEALTRFLNSGDTATRNVAVVVLAHHLDRLAASDPRAVLVCAQMLETFHPGDETSCAVLLDVIPTILQRTGSGQAAKCREVVTEGLKLPSVERRLAAIRIALHPHLRMRADLLPLLNDPEVEIRRAALFAVGPATDGEPVIGDEELFHWLHDPDEVVRKVCVDALVSRGRSDSEISLGRRLRHPLPSERLKLLLDLRYDHDVRDPEPWLERLSRDPDPGVRAGSVRVAIELASEQQLPIPPWIGSLADADPNLTVRRIARFYQHQRAGRENPGVRTVGGP